MGQQIVDWSILQNHDVVRIIKNDASRVVRQYEGVLEYEDLVQEGYLAVATQSHIVKSYLANGDLGFLSRWIWQRMTEIAKKQNVAHKRTTSYDAMDWSEL